MNNSVKIIAEAGVNHNGDIDLAKRLIVEAKKAGADFVKFQSFVTENLVTQTAKTAEYQQVNINDHTVTQYDMLKRYELTFEQQQALFQYGKELGIQVVSTAFDLESIDFLYGMNITFWKIPSGEITNTPYLRKIGSFGMPIVLSSGMSTVGDIEYALNTLEDAGTSREKIVLLHCTTEYPAPYDEVNLKAMQTLSTIFGVKTGYSDHTEGIAVPIAAATLGAAVIEKHFTLDCTMEGPDHAASLEPAVLKEMIDSIRCIEMAQGTGVKKPTRSEEKNISVARKSIVASKTINTGDVFSTKNLTVKRPSDGISPKFWDLIIGKPAGRNYEKDEKIEWNL